MTPYTGHAASTAKPAIVTSGRIASVHPTPSFRITCVVMKIWVISVATCAMLSNCAKLPSSWLKVSESPRMMFA